MKRILFIITSAAKIGKANKPTGFWYEELTTPYYEFIDHGFKVDFTSPLGGKPPHDPNSLKNNDEDAESVKRFLKDEKASQQLTHTHPLEKINFDRYDAIYFPGGHGAMVDLPNNKMLAEKLARFFEQGKIVAAVCHGPAGLISAKRQDGKSILYEKKVNSFTNSEEEKTGLENDVPFLLEDKITSLDARYEKGADFEEFTVQDKNLITGQNPASSKRLAELVIAALNK